MGVDLSQEFQLDSSVIHLNHAGMSPWPSRTVSAVEQFAKENRQQGSLHYPKWIEIETHLRRGYQEMINATSASEIALLKNTSEALSVVAYGLNWWQGDNIVGIAQEFPSNRIVWQSLEARFEVEYRQVDILSAEDPEEALFAAVDSSTRLIAVSAVQYASGLRLNLEKIGAFCAQRDILFCIDGIQQIGAMPFDVQACQAHFVAADGHKWMMGPEGVALFYCASEQREQLKLNQFGWHMTRNMQDFETQAWEPADNARRFECGSPNMLGIFAQQASISLLQEIGIKQVYEDLQIRVDLIIEAIQQRGYTLLSPAAVARRAGIVTFSIPGVGDHKTIYQTLMQEGILCAYRMGGIRFSPHFYTPLEAIVSAFQRIDEIHKTT